MDPRMRDLIGSCNATNFDSSVNDDDFDPQIVQGLLTKMHVVKPPITANQKTDLANVVSQFT